MSQIFYELFSIPNGANILPNYFLNVVFWLFDQMLINFVDELKVETTDEYNFFGSIFNLKLSVFVK